MLRFNEYQFLCYSCSDRHGDSFSIPSTFTYLLTESIFPFDNIVNHSCEITIDGQHYYALSCVGDGTCTGCGDALSSHSRQIYDHDRLYNMAEHVFTFDNNILHVYKGWISIKDVYSLPMNIMLDFKIT